MVDQITQASGISLLAGNGSLPSVGPRPAASPVIGAPPTQPATAVSPSSTTTAAAQVNQHLQQTQSDLKLQVDPSTDRMIFQVIQKGTGQVLLQIPSEEVLGMSRRVQELESQMRDSGALVDKQG